jgi:hypothetical protein
LCMRFGLAIGAKVDICVKTGVGTCVA